MPRAPVEIAVDLEAARAELIRIERTVDGILPCHPALPRVLMRLQGARTRLTDVIAEILVLEE